LLLIRSVLIVVIIGTILVGTGVLLSNVVGRVIPLTPLMQVVLSFVISLALISGAFFYYVYHGFGYQGDIIRRVDTQKRIVTLTFDDGPHPVYTPQILDILAEYQVTATFFVVGSHVEKYPEIVERIYREGHEIGNHTYNHINVPTANAAQLSSEIFQTSIKIMELTGEYPLYVRPPRGMYDSRFRRLSELMGMRIILWSLSSQDWLETMTPEKIENRVLQRVTPGDIILFHDSGSLVKSEGASRLRTVQALPGIIEGLKEQDYQIVSLTRLLRYPLSDEVSDEEDLHY